MPLSPRLLAVLFVAVTLASAVGAEGVEESGPGPLDPGRPQVVLVHGIWDTAAKFRKMAAALAKDGWQAHAITLTPNDGSVPLEQSAAQLRSFVDDQLGPDLPFSMVAFSMGGLVARYYLQRLDGLARVTRLVTISSPHNGTWPANLESLPGVAEMRPGSGFLLDLNDDVMRLSAIPVTSIWSPQDLGIQPPESARLPLGADVPIPHGMHSMMLSDDRVIRAVLAALHDGNPGG